MNALLDTASIFFYTTMMEDNLINLKLTVKYFQFLQTMVIIDGTNERLSTLCCI